eukprot:PhF_6_TR42883/c0_g1_i2/m.64969
MSRLTISSVLMVFLFTLIANAQVPTYPPTYQMNLSTIIMPCNYSGYTDPSTTTGWALIDFDWSNAKSIWAANKPMDCAEQLYKQVLMTTKASPQTHVWVYRNSIKALPWYTSVRKKLTDPAYAVWHLPFGNQTIHVPRCDTNYNPPLCSDLYHDQSQTPGYPSGDGTCSAPACDVGTIPVGEYIWDPRAWNVSVNGQTFGEWFINDYLFDATGGGSDLISGFFFDDYWSIYQPSEYEPHASQDMGLTRQELVDINNAYWSNMKEVYAAVLARKKFSWQQLYTGQSEKDIATTCPGPLVMNTTCAADLRHLCKPGGSPQTRFMMYAFSPGRCNMDPSTLPYFAQDLANFLLVRGPYAVLGHGWLGCSKHYLFPEELNLDYGTPIGLCQETAPNSGVFVRNWTKAAVKMDCNTWTPTITMN